MSVEKFRKKERELAIKKSNARKKKKRRRQNAKVFLFVLLFLIILAGILSLTVFFKTEHIKVTGSSTYTAEEIISTAEINKGDNLFLVFEKKVSQRLSKKLPLIDSVKIKRTLPDTVTINITETKEEICFNNEKEIFSANSTGKVINKYQIVPDNLIMFTVSKNTKLKSGENISFSNDREAELYKEFCKLIDSFEHKINFINLSDPYNSYMKIEDRIIVKLGSNSYFDKKISYLNASLKGISENAQGVFDLSAWTPENRNPVLTYCDISDYEK